MTTIVAGNRSFYNKRKNILFKNLVDFIWVAIAFVWPFLKWVLNIEVFFRFIQMIYFWETPNITAGWTFIIHFSVLTAVYLFVSTYRIKNKI